MDVPLLEGALDFQHPPCSDTCCLYHSSLQQHYPLLLWSWPEPQLCALRISSCWRGSVLFHSSGFPVLTRKTSDRYCQCLGIIYTKKALLPHHFWKLLKATTNIFCLFFLPRFGHINFSVPLSMWLHSSPHRSHHFSRLRKPQLSLPDTALELCLLQLWSSFSCIPSSPAPCEGLWGCQPPQKWTRTGWCLAKDA